MPSTTTVLKTNNPYVDSLLSGVKWLSGNLTYSFPQLASHYGFNSGNGENLNNFETFNPVQQTAVRAVLKNYSAVANLNFTETTETATNHATIRYAESDTPNTAWAYYPSTSQAGGDVWFNNSKNWYDNPTVGSYAYQTVLHETGHALGLKHPHQTSGTFPVAPLDKDSLEYTVMSYRSYTGGPASSYTVSNGSYPQTLMMSDIQAIQHLYGANYSYNSGDTIYTWSPLQSKIFETIWDGGGNDTFDFSNYATNLLVNLTPGGWTTTASGQLANLGSGKVAVGNIANALMFKGNDSSLIENVLGGSGDDRFIGNTKNNVFDGNSGTDSVLYNGLSSNYTLTQNSDGSWSILKGLELDTLFDTERLEFTDKQINLLTGEETDTPPPPNNVPVIATNSILSQSVTEWSDRSVAESRNYDHTAKGYLAYTDPDVLDTHTASFVAKGSGYFGSFALNTFDDKVDWTFTVKDSDINHLYRNQTITQSYDVSIDDGNGGIASKAVVVKINGSYDPGEPSYYYNRGNGPISLLGVYIDTDTDVGLPG